MNKRFVIVDLETTGHSPKQGDKMIQFAAVVVENGRIVERFSSFLNPKMEIPPFISQLTNIHDDMVKQAPLFEDISEKIVELLEGAYFVAHNVAFDLTFLQEELHQCGYETLYNSTVDTVELARILLPTVDGYKLNQLAEYLHIKHENPHQADSDAEVTARILLVLLDKLSQLPLSTLKQLYTLSLHLKSEIGELIQQVIDDKKDKNEEAYDIVHGVALRKLQPNISLASSQHHTYEQFERTKRERFSNALTSFQDRAGQWEMMDFVYESLTNNEHALIEAGTGIGKTLAYLVPAAFYANKHKVPVVISTHTITLQQQLMDKDLSSLKSLVPFPVQAAILKGREHYINVRKFIQFLKERHNNYDAILTKAKLLIWLTETETGDIDEINLPSGGRLFWEQMNESNPSQPDFKHPWKQYSFYNRAQERAKQADIIVTNHRLLLMDVMSDHQLLPSYEQVIIDEAHHLDSIASEELGETLDYFSIHSLLNRIGSLQDKGLLAKVNQIIKKYELSVNLHLLQRFLEQLHAECDDLFRLIHSYVIKRVEPSQADVGRLSYRYEVDRESGGHWKAIQELTSRVRFLLKDVLSWLDASYHQFDEKEHELTRNEQSTVHEFQTALRQFEQISYQLYSLLFQQYDDEVTWFEIEAKGAANATFLYSQPISVADALADDFFTKKKSVILTSATLTVNHSFNYVIQELGLYDFQPLQLIIPSPFNYQKQSKVYIPTDMPAVTEVTLEEYSAMMAESILDVASITKGRMLVLFTSYDMLKATYGYMKELNDLEEFVLLGQGVTSRNRNRLLKDFVQFEKSILLGTNSLWEGVDLPGEILSCLVIVRLPFSSPSQPYLAAKFEQMKKAGKSPFMEYSLPQAVIRLKQGFGRLIRTEKDRGAVFIFDNRITRTSYGQYFLQSLPPVNIAQKPFASLLDEFSDWWE
ncbi:ATP-dependent DNA helicase DinG [Priestia megaterium]|nr:ATP-dependent DNA helicase DinG [Priestia megaterium]